MTSRTEETSLPNPAPRLWSDIAASACPVFGCLGWILLIPFLETYDKSEQLARFFTALVNMFLIGIVGGSSTVMCFLGLHWSRHIEQRFGFRTSQIGKSAAYLGLTMGAIILLVQIPYLVWYLH